MEPLPAVSYVMPVLNEAGYVEAALTSVLTQDYEAPCEVVLALGPSTDGTDEVVARLAAGDPRVRTVANPRSDIPVGLNLAITASRHPVIVRVDAHSTLPPGYTRRAVATLLETGAANVGGIMAAVGRPGVQAAVAWAYNSRLGLGGGAYHSTDVPAGEAESAYLGVMRASALAEVGGFDETIRRGEDWELNSRLIAAGHKVWLDPGLRVEYWPRSTWSALWRQFWATGIWRGELVRRLHLRNGPRFFAPPALVVATAATGLLVPVAAVTGSLLPLVVALGPLAYAALLLGVVLLVPGPPMGRLRRAGALAVMHVAWGTGFLIGVTRGAKDAVDTSRASPTSPPPSSGARRARRRDRRPTG
jgi:succinoglycan biosynthesis protein ExoA